MYLFRYIQVYCFSYTSKFIEIKYDKYIYHSTLYHTYKISIPNYHNDTLCEQYVIIYAHFLDCIFYLIIKYLYPKTITIIPYFYIITNTLTLSYKLFSASACH